MQQKESPKTAGASSCCLSLCRLFRSEQVSDGCKLQWEWVVIADLWTDISLMVTPSIETKSTSGVAIFLFLLAKFYSDY